MAMKVTVALTNEEVAVPVLKSAKHNASKQREKLCNEAEEERDGADVEGAKKEPISRARKRQGSLRKAAMAKMKECSGSLLREPIIAHVPTTITASNMEAETDTLGAPPPLEQPNHENASTISAFSITAIPDSRAHPFASCASRINSFEEPERPTPKLPASPTISSPEGPYVSTTDDDDTAPFYPPSASSSISSFGLHAQGTAASLGIQRRALRSDQQAASSTAQAHADPELEHDWDYSETEWWGWIILIATWIVFVVVMGSCLGVWSWAWDVGETPYAPPELEDDATLPITGYYPALIVCTAVMSWVWVVVAWVGMKYFRHSKVV